MELLTWTLLMAAYGSLFATATPYFGLEKRGCPSCTAETVTVTQWETTTAWSCLTTTFGSSTRPATSVLDILSTSGVTTLFQGASSSVNESIQFPSATAPSSALVSSTQNSVPSSVAQSSSQGNLPSSTGPAAALSTGASSSSSVNVPGATSSGPGSSNPSSVDITSAVTSSSPGSVVNSATVASESSTNTVLTVISSSTYITQAASSSTSIGSPAPFSSGPAAQASSSQGESAASSSGPAVQASSTQAAFSSGPAVQQSSSQEATAASSTQAAFSSGPAVQQSSSQEATAASSTQAAFSSGPAVQQSSSQEATAASSTQAAFSSGPEAQVSSSQGATVISSTVPAIQVSSSQGATVISSTGPAIQVSSSQAAAASSSEPGIQVSSTQGASVASSTGPAIQISSSQGATAESSSGPAALLSSTQGSEGTASTAATPSSTDLLPRSTVAASSTLVIQSSSFVTSTSSSAIRTRTNSLYTLSTSSATVNSYAFTCSTGIPASFNIIVQEAGKPRQYLSEVDVPGSNAGENFWGYEKLPLSTNINSAAVFSSNSYQNLVSSAKIHGTTGITTVYGAVRGSALGNSNVQMYPANHVVGVSDMFNYTVSVNSQCMLSLAVKGAALDCDCGGVLAVLTPRFFWNRGSSCIQVQLYAIEITPPYVSSSITSTPVVPPSTSIVPSSSAIPTSSDTSASSAQISSSGLAAPSTTAALVATTSVPACMLDPYFKIVAYTADKRNQPSIPPQVLYDPQSNNDDKLQFTTDFTQGAVFELSSTGQLEFNVTNIWGAPVVLLSNQDSHNAGDEAIYFSTNTVYDTMNYLPVVATLNNDCSLGLTLPYDGASFLQLCEGSLWLMLSQSRHCRNVVLDIQPYYASVTATAAAATSTA